MAIFMNTFVRGANKRKEQIIKKYGAEFVGTFWLVLGGAEAQF